MDASAYIMKEGWENIISNNNWNNVELRDNRYNQIIHMVSGRINLNFPNYWSQLWVENLIGKNVPLALELNDFVLYYWWNW